MRITITLLTLALAISLAHAQTPASATPTTVYKLGDQGIQMPTLIKSVDADFSEDARARRIDGRCLVGLIVDASGVPQDVHIVDCTDQTFAKNSLAAVAQYRFDPGTKADGTPVPVRLNVYVRYRLEGAPAAKPGFRVKFRTPAGTTSADPDANGIYPFSKKTEAPLLQKFTYQDFVHAAASRHGEASCDVMLTIDADGKPSNAEILQCTPDKLSQHVFKSLLKSRFKPGTLNGQPVPIRATLSLTYVGLDE